MQPTERVAGSDWLGDRHISRRLRRCQWVCLPDCSNSSLPQAACGDQAFTKAVRDFVAKHPRDTTFYELEYQPGRADTSVSENGFRNPRRYLSRLPKPNPVANHGLRRRNDHLESYWNEDSSHVAHPTQVTLRDARRRVNVIHQGRA
jgi:hypothetical protein